MSEVLPFSRAIVERKTGRIMGPLAPIYKEDWPFIILPDFEILWRYMDLYKFEDMLRTNTLYFTRPDQFVDPFEGRFSTGNLTKRSKSDELFHSLYKFVPSDPTSDHEIHRHVVFINCWHRDTRESFEMWKAYTTSPESVVITTSVKALRRFLPKKLMKFAVKYLSLEKTRTEFSGNALFYYKPIEYGFEREFRLLRSPEEHETFHSEKPEDLYRRIAMNPKKIVHRIITHPNASKDLKARVDALVAKVLPHRKREDSALEM